MLFRRPTKSVGIKLVNSLTCTLLKNRSNVGLIKLLGQRKYKAGITLQHEPDSQLVIDKWGFVVRLGVLVLLLREVFGGCFLRFLDLLGLYFLLTYKIMTRLSFLR